MALLDSEIRIMASELLDDTEYGGGRITKNEIVDGLSNNMFQDISDLDRTLGRVSLRKFYASVMNPDRETYFGVNIIIDKIPQDPNVTVNLYSTRNWSDRRPSAINRMESYLARGPRLSGYLWDQHITGQKVLLILQSMKAALPSAGDTLIVVSHPGMPNEQSQFVRITKVQAEEREFSHSACNSLFTMNVLTVTISESLLFDVLGGGPHCKQDAGETMFSSSTVNAPSKLYDSVVADAARYYGMSYLTTAVGIGDYRCTCDNIFTKVIPSAQVETAISNGKPNQVLSTPIDSGTYITYTTTGALSSTNKLYVGNSIYPGTLSITMGSSVLLDTGGSLSSEGVIIGAIDYANGVVSVSSGTYPGDKTISYKPSAIVSRNSESRSTLVTSATRSGTYVFTLHPIPSPGTTSVSYRTQGNWYMLFDNGKGSLKGFDSSIGSGTLSYTSGYLTVTLGALPDIETRIIVSFGTRSIETSLPYTSLKLESPIDLDVPTAEHINGGTLTFTWNIEGTSYTANEAGGFIFGDATGTVDYTSGTASIAPNILPHQGAEITAHYTYGDPIKETFPELAINNGKIEVQLSAGNLIPGSIRLNYGISTTIHGKSIANDNGDFRVTSYVKAHTVTSLYIDGVYYSETYPYAVYSPSDLAQIFSESSIRYCTDDGNGNIKFGSTIIGQINYVTGFITFQSQDQISMALPAKKYTVVIPYQYYYITHSYYYRDANYTLQVYHYTSQHLTYDYIYTYHILNNAYIAQGNSVVVTYTTSSSPNAKTVTSTFTPKLDITPNFSETIIPGSITLFINGDRVVDRNGELYGAIDPATGSGTKYADVNYLTGLSNFQAWRSNTPNNYLRYSTVTQMGNTLVGSTVFRTALCPIRPGSFSLQFKMGTDQPLTTIVVDASGVIQGDNINGLIDYVTGIVDINFGSMVVAAEYATEPWYSAQNVVDGKIWKPDNVISETLSYGAVAYSYIPLDKSIIGVDPVRLPSDGRVSIFRTGEVVVLHHTASTVINSPVIDQTVNCGTARLASIRVFDEGNSNTRVPTAQYTTDLNVGTVTITDVTGLVGPLRVEYRIEDMALISDVQINGTLSVTKPFTHNFPIGSGVSSALIAGDLQATSSIPFDQVSWTGDWEDIAIGNPCLAEFNYVQYPISVTDDSSIQERWAIIFTSTNDVRIIGETVGQIATMPITSTIQPLNPTTGKPYFKISPLAFGSGWSIGNVIRFNTVAANFPVWAVRTVQQGPATGTSDNFSIQVRGNSNV